MLILKCPTRDCWSLGSMSLARRAPLSENPMYASIGLSTFAGEARGIGGANLVLKMGVAIWLVSRVAKMRAHTQS